MVLMFGLRKEPLKEVLSTTMKGSKYLEQIAKCTNDRHPVDCQDFHLQIFDSSLCNAIQFYSTKNYSFQNGNKVESTPLKSSFNKN